MRLSEGRRCEATGGGSLHISHTNGEFIFLDILLPMMRIFYPRIGKALLCENIVLVGWHRCSVRGRQIPTPRLVFLPMFPRAASNWTADKVPGGTLERTCHSGRIMIEDFGEGLLQGEL